MYFCLNEYILVARLKDEFFDLRYIKIMIGPLARLVQNDDMHHTVINLRIPPPSPTGWINIIPPPEEPDPSQPFAHKKQKRHTRSKKRKRLDPITEALPVLPVAESDNVVEPTHTPNLHPPDDMVSSDFMTPETRNNDQSTEDDDDRYMQYVEAVLADDALFYQISADFFIVSGWDVREGCNNVRLPD